MRCVYCGREYLVGQASLEGKPREHYCNCGNNPPSESMLLWKVLNRLDAIEKRMIHVQSGAPKE